MPAEQACLQSREFAAGFVGHCINAMLQIPFNQRCAFE